MSLSEAAERFRGKSVAIVGSGPGSLTNRPGFVDSHDIVVRVNNYKTGPNQGKRCDVHYSFYGTSIRKSAAVLVNDGVTLCMAKCPDGKPIESDWHERHGRQNGIDFRYIYRNRAGWWFCDTFVPSEAHFLKSFQLLGGHVPTTGFSAILDVLACEPRSVYLSGFDFFASGIHNVDERWLPGNPQDPIRHLPEAEAQWVAANADRLTFDYSLTARLKGLH